MSKCIKICVTEEDDEYEIEPLSPEELNKFLAEFLAVFLKATNQLTIEVEKPEESEDV